MAARFLGDIVVQQYGRWWILKEPLRYIEDDNALGCVLVPAGFITDFASIPRFLWNILHPTDPTYAGAALLHDRLFETHLLPRREADDLFFRAMAVTGTPTWKRYLIWSAVRLFGQSAYESGPDRQYERLLAAIQIRRAAPRYLR